MCTILWLLFVLASLQKTLGMNGFVYKKCFRGVTSVRTFFLFLVGFVFCIPLAVEAAPPLISCSVEQARATERWWYFGNRGVIDFGVSGTSRTLSVNPQSITMLEGSTVVTDTAGELQFYSNGQTVWNKNNQAMPNGTGLTAAPSATQTVASFPSLSRPGIYFVVHNGGAFETGGSGPLRYSEVDMSLDGGLGDITPGVKNILLDGGANTATEGLIAIPNSDGTGFWVITATGADEVGNNNIVAHEFDGDGPTGTIVRSPMSTPNGDTFATFNVSPDMTTLVQHFGNFADESGQLRLLSIDAESGVLEEIVTWDLPSTGSNGTYNYSADFSPDGRWVYATRIFGTGKLFRYDIETHTTAQALEDNIEIVGSIGTNGGQVKRAPDGRMYVANYNAPHLSIVNDPNNLTDPDFVQAGVTLPSGAVSQFGLPQTVAGCPAPKNAPVNLNVASAGHDRITLSWSEPVDDGGETLLGYKIDRSLDGSVWATIVSNTASTSLTYLDTELSADTTYFYRIFAVYDAVTSDSSNTASVQTDDVVAYAVEYTASAGGTVTGSVSQSVTAGGNATSVTAVPDQGYVFSKWSDDSTQNPRTDLSISGTISVQALFVVAPENTATERRSSRSGSSIVSRYTNLLETGNSQSAEALRALYPQVFQNALGSTESESSFSSSASNASCKLEHVSRELRFGSEGEDVRSLQAYLNCEGFLLGETGPGSPGNETIYFSDRTHAALIRFQEAYVSDILTPLSLMKGTGIFGVMSKKKADALSGIR